MRQAPRFGRALAPLCVALTLAACEEAAPWPDEHCESGVCPLCVFGGETEGGFCVAADREPADPPLDLSDPQAHRAEIILRTLSPLRFGMSPDEATAAVGREPVHDQAVTLDLGQVQLQGTYRTLAWERAVRFLDAPLSLYGSFADGRLVAIWWDASRRDVYFAQAIPPTACNPLTDFIKARYGPQGSIVQLPDSLFDHSTNVYATDQPRVWRQESRNLNVVDDDVHWIAYAAVFEVMTDLTHNGTHYDHLEGCRSEFFVAERR